jgi:hypothetical protein
VAAGFCAVSVRAATQRARISPHEQTSAVIEGTRVTITYGRPSMRGRTIFGALVPYGLVWCPGADEATTLDSTRALQFGPLRVPAGPHTMWMLPTADRWTLIISREASGFHTQYHEQTDLGRVGLAKRALDAPVEQLTFAITQNSSSTGIITMTWAMTAASATFTTAP